MNGPLPQEVAGQIAQAILLCATLVVPVLWRWLR